MEIRLRAGAFTTTSRFTRNYDLCFLTENRKPETTQKKNVTPTSKSLGYWFSYEPTRVKIGPHRELEKNPEVGLSS